MNVKNWALEMMSYVDRYDALAQVACTPPPYTPGPAQHGAVRLRPAGPLKSGSCVQQV